ncbi:hypothetical protein [Amphibacillus jilinensis]|uniref:hypothetical protein n=1 Tax=Amphibacillus jilinensis TaxID=1216008 RepID=UPI0002D9146C|nr:hypothetical protein [Amphibacillus jilinensis]
MENKNTSVKWLQERTNIDLDKRIEDYKNPIRGIYGIFVKDENSVDKRIRCVYVGRSVSIYERMFDSNGGHVAKIKEKRHFIEELNKASGQENIKVFVRILEEVPLVFDDYYKDMQRLASAENDHINKYQSINQCLNQVPEGNKMTKKDWEDKKFN